MCRCHSKSLVAQLYIRAGRRWGTHSKTWIVLHHLQQQVFCEEQNTMFFANPLFFMILFLLEKYSYETTSSNRGCRQRLLTVCVQGKAQTWQPRTGWLLWPLPWGLLGKSPLRSSSCLIRILYTFMLETQWDFIYLQLGKQSTVVGWIPVSLYPWGLYGHRSPSAQITHTGLGLCYPSLTAPAALLTAPIYKFKIQ